MARKQSAGCLLYRMGGCGPRVLLVHPSGAYNRRAPWSIPKGEPEPGEPLEAAARRETAEETGIDATGPLVDLGFIDYRRSHKRVHAFAGPLPAEAEPRCASWEIDRVETVDLDAARERLHPDQLPFLDRLIRALAREPQR
jgi:predicted NUDIX family NTP pyrophosphohydrolase